MPGLCFLRRTWKIGSDDLVIYFGISTVLRALWFITVTIVFLSHLSNDHSKIFSKGDHNCGDWLHFYLVGYIVIIFISVIVEIIISFISSRGTIFETEKRSHIVKYLYLRLLINFVDIAWFGLGLYYAFFREPCNNRFDRFLSMGIVIFNLVWIVVTLSAAYIVFDPIGGMTYSLEEKRKKQSYGSIEALDAKRKLMEKYQDNWMKNCRLLFCCTKTKNSKDNVLLFASKVFAEYFGNYDNLVPSDILAGLILLRQKQKYEESSRIREELRNTNATYHQVQKNKNHKSVRRHQNTSSAIPFDMENEEEVQILDTVTHFARYAFASYGWPIHCYASPCSLGLLKHIRCCGNCCRKEEHVIGDNCCLCNFAAQKSVLKVVPETFIYVSYSDELFYTPFSVIVDHSKEAIIIACRGTLSLNDVLTDLAVEECQIPGYDPTFTAHNGFLQAATSIKEKLEEEHLIEKALNFDMDKGTDSYNLVIVGHSLGGGTATLLAFLLRQQYPDLMCYAYGPSGSAVSLEASDFARDFVYSVVLGKDIIARLNLYTMNEMQHNIIQMLRRTKLPKWRILRGCIFNCFLCCTKSSDHSFEEYFESEEDIQGLEPFIPDSSVRKLYMAGKVVHICKTKSIYPRFGFKQAQYRPYWSVPSDFDTILISNLMLQDHFPDVLLTALQKILPDDIEEIISPESSTSGSANINIIEIVSPESEDEESNKLINSETTTTA